MRDGNIWTRRTTLGVAGAITGLLALGIGPANAQPSGPAKPRKQELPPPPQVRGLDFTLGTFDCTQPGQTKLEVTMAAKRGLGGHYYYSDVTQYMAAPYPNVYGKGVYGWNPVDGTFIMQYHDNWGSSGTASSPGWQDGHLRFAGNLLQVLNPNPTGTAKGVTLGIKDDYQVIDRNRFTIAQTVTSPDGTSKNGNLDCRRR
ncbi:DUF1579 family protein [Actinomadura sp. 9N215]|uniref:DUF1579 family protein n=1 Tax=Actinomadura sp. 9N215 TaxID=3375150 RepID=UPI0037AFB3CC